MSIKNFGPNRRSRFKQGLYKVENVSKYKGDLSKVIYRSGWEKILMKYCDLSASVLAWSSEPVAIPYISPLDNRQHKYWVDFFILEQKPDGTTTKYLVEVKPSKDYKTKPLFEGRNTPKKVARYKREMETWLVNNAKFKFALEFAKTIGMEFIIVDETSLFGKKMTTKKKK